MGPGRPKATLKRGFMRAIDFEDVVRSAYRVMLNRPPESDTVVSRWAETCESLDVFYRAMLESAEFQFGRQPAQQSPFWHYNSMFNAEDLIRKFAASNLVARPGYIVNFLGVAVDPKFLPSVLADRQGTIEDIPIPANWHADIAEWAAALRAVELSSSTFKMVELGCGWGCWMNNTGVAARSLGKRVHLIGIEGDPGHCDFARESLAVNGFKESEVTLVQGIAAAHGGTALFPRQSEEVDSWGLGPVIGATPEQRVAAAATHSELPMYALADVVADQDRIDLLHIDIQGGEADLVADCIDVLSSKFAYLLIGTHSRPIEGALFQTLEEAGWIQEIERPAINCFIDGRPWVAVDGVQGWRNPRLLPPMQ